MTDENSPATTAEIIAELVKIRDRKRELAAEESELNERFDALKGTLIARMEEEGSTKVSSKLASVSLTETIVPQVDDRDAMNAWILETGNLYILQSRVASGAYRELVETGQEVPGVTPFTKKDISLRAL